MIYKLIGHFFKFKNLPSDFVFYYMGPVDHYLQFFYLHGLPPIYHQNFNLKFFFIMQR